MTVRLLCMLLVISCVSCVSSPPIPGRGPSVVNHYHSYNPFAPQSQRDFGFVFSNGQCEYDVIGPSLSVADLANYVKTECLAEYIDCTVTTSGHTITLGEYCPPIVTVVVNKNRNQKSITLVKNAALDVTIAVSDRPANSYSVVN